MIAVNFQSTKTFNNYPCAHRQWRHDGSCALVHGYSRSFHFVFECVEMDKCGFVVDYGGLKEFKQMLDEKFDHTLLLNEDDPLLPDFKELEKKGAAKVVTLPYGIGMEGTAQFLCERMDEFIRLKTKGRAWCVSA